MHQPVRRLSFNVCRVVSFGSPGVFGVWAEPVLSSRTLAGLNGTESKLDKIQYFHVLNNKLFNLSFFYILSRLSFLVFLSFSSCLWNQKEIRRCIVNACALAAKTDQNGRRLARDGDRFQKRHQVKSTCASAQHPHETSPNDTTRHDAMRCERFHNEPLQS